MNPRINVRLKKTEMELYKDYFHLVNLQRPDELRLSQREIDLAASFAFLGNFSVEPRSKNIKNFAILRDLTQMSSSMISQYIQRLIEKKTLLKDEDGLIRLPDAVLNIVKIIKRQIENEGKFVFNYDIEYEVH